MGSSRFTARADGTITGGLFKSFNGKPKRWREIGPYLYQEIDGQERMWFRRDAPGRMTIFTDFAAFAFQRASLTETRGFNLSVLVSVLVIFVLTLILWPVAGLVRRHYNQPLNLDASGLRLRRWTRLVCAWNVLVTIGWASFFSYGSGQIGRLNSGVDAWVYLLQISTIIGGLGSIIALVNAYRSVTSSRWWWKKIQDVLIALACLGFVWMGFAWRLFYVGARF
jgi:hypothetical protein